MEMRFAAYALYHFVLVSEERKECGVRDDEAETPTRTNKEIHNGTEMSDNKVAICKCLAIISREVGIRLSYYSAFRKCVLD